MSRLIPAQYDAPVFGSVAASAPEAQLLSELAGLTDEATQLAAGTPLGYGSAMTPRQLLVQAAYAKTVNDTFIYASDGRFNVVGHGVWYAADTLTTAAYEVQFHLALYHRKSNTPSQTFLYTSYTASVDHNLYDTRQDQAYLGALAKDKEDYLPGQSLAQGLRDHHQEVPGLLYESVRAPNPGQLCVALLYPQQVHGVERARQVRFEWDAASGTVTVPRTSAGNE